MVSCFRPLGLVPGLTFLVALGLSCTVLEPTLRERADPEAPLGQERPRVKRSLLEEHPSLLPPPARTPPALPPSSGLEEPEWPDFGSDQRVSLELRNQSLVHAIQFLAAEAGVNIYLDPDLDRTVNASFPDTTPGAALEALLRRNGLRLREDPPGIYWVEPADGSEIRTVSFQVQNMDLEQHAERLKELVEESTDVVVDASNNLVVVRGPRRDLEVIQEYLNSADRLQKQVLIEVRIVEARLDESFQLGITAALAGDDLNDHAASLLQELGVPRNDIQFVFQSETGSIDATIQALSEYVGLNLVSSPRILTTSNKEAVIKVVREIPYINITSVTQGTSGGIGTQVTQEVQFKEAGITLTVTPVVQEGGVVSITIDQEFSEVIDTFQDIPVIDNRQMQSRFLVPDRGTIVLGGLMQERTVETDTGIPVLMDLPLLGRLFRSDEDFREKRELLVFITPYVVDPEDAGLLSGAVRDLYEQRIRQQGLVEEE